MNHIAKTTKNNSIKIHILAYKSEIVNKNEETFNNIYGKVQVFYKKIKKKTKKKGEHFRRNLDKGYEQSSHKKRYTNDTNIYIKAFKHQGNQENENFKMLRYYFQLPLTLEC